MSKLRGAAQAWLRACGRFERGLTFLAFMVVIAVVFADVVSREFVGTGIHWARQAGVYANVFVVMFGIGLASADAAHLRPRFADGWLPRAWSPVIDQLSEFLMAAFCGAFAWLALGVVAETYSLQERSAVLRTLVWPVQAALPIAFTLAAIRHCLYGLFPVLRPSSDGAAADFADDSMVG